MQIGLDGEQLGAAVGQLEPVDGGRGPQGTVRFAQVSLDRCYIEATLEGFTPGTLALVMHDAVLMLAIEPSGKHALAVHEYGDLSAGQHSVGDVFDPLHRRHGGSDIKPAGDIGIVHVDESGVRTCKERRGEYYAV